MPIENYPLISQSLTERRLAQFTEFLPELEGAMADGQIENARYTKAKEAISRIIETAWLEGVRKPYSWNRDYIQNARPAEQDQLQDLSNAPQTNTLAKIMRLAQALPDTSAGRDVRALLAELSPLVTLLKEAKGLAVKKTAAAKPASATEIYTAPTASRTAVHEVLDELKGITAQARDGMRDAIAQRHERSLARFLAAAGENTSNRSFNIYTYCRDLARKAGHQKADPYLRLGLERMVVSSNDPALGHRVYAAKQGVREIIYDAAGKEADAICAQYIEKNLAKLAPIIEGRGDFASMQVIGRSVNPGQMEGRLRLSFASDASFEARSQAVLSFSPLGTPFMRFPLTFHDVRLSNGDVMPRPSEKRMNEIFCAENKVSPSLEI